MRYILLPGFSEKNKNWAENLKSDLNKLGIDLEYIEWSHWGNGGQFNIELEQERIKNLIKDDEVVMFAKSIGTIALVTLIPSKVKQIRGAILMGIPFNERTEVMIKKYSNLKRLDPNRVKVIQNSEDPYGSAEDVKFFISEIDENIDFFEVEASTHEYLYADLIKDLIEDIS